MAAAIRIKQLADYLAVSVSTIRRMIKNDPTFPRPITLSEGVTVFRTAEVDAWLSRKQGGGSV